MFLEIPSIFQEIMFNLLCFASGDTDLSRLVSLNLNVQVCLSWLGMAELCYSVVVEKMEHMEDDDWEEGEGRVGYNNNWVEGMRERTENEIVG